MDKNPKNSCGGCGCTLIMIGILCVVSGYKGLGENFFNLGMGIIVIPIAIVIIIGIILSLQNKN